MALAAALVSPVAVLPQDADTKSSTSPPSDKPTPAFRDFFGMKLVPSGREIHVPVEINMCDGLIEYVLVHQNGKTHESLFRSEISAEHFNAALLLFLPSDRGLPVESLHNLKIDLYAHWVDEKGRPHKVAVDRWIKNTVLEKPMKPGPWGYVGSRIENNVYVASRDGSYIAVREDPDTIVGNPRPESNQDDIWMANIPEPWKEGEKLTLILHIPKIAGRAGE